MSRGSNWSGVACDSGQPTCSCGRWLTASDAIQDRGPSGSCSPLLSLLNATRSENQPLVNSLKLSREQAATPSNCCAKVPLLDGTPCCKSRGALPLFLLLLLYTLLWPHSAPFEAEGPTVWNCNSIRAQASAEIHGVRRLLVHITFPHPCLT